MTNYIGTATSRVDGRAKVTGEARYAGEFNAGGLAYGSVIVANIPKGRIARVDASTSASYGVIPKSRTNLLRFASGSSGIVLAISSRHAALTRTGSKSGSGKYR